MNKSKCGRRRLFATTPPQSSVFPYSLQVSKKAKGTRQVAYILNNIMDISVVEPEPDLLAGAGAGAGMSKFRLRLPAPGQLK